MLSSFDIDGEDDLQMDLVLAKCDACHLICILEFVSK